MKTQDGKSILIDLGEEGWKFSCDGYKIDIEGLGDSPQEEIEAESNEEEE